MTDGELVAKFSIVITKQLRTLGVELHNDLGHRMRPGGGEEKRIVEIVARHLVQHVVNPECQTSVAESTT